MTAKFAQAISKAGVYRSICAGPERSIGKKDRDEEVRSDRIIDCQVLSPKSTDKHLF